MQQYIWGLLLGCWLSAHAMSSDDVFFDKELSRREKLLGALPDGIFKACIIKEWNDDITHRCSQSTAWYISGIFADVAQGKTPVVGRLQGNNYCDAFLAGSCNKIMNYCDAETRAYEWATLMMILDTFRIFCKDNTELTEDEKFEECLKLTPKKGLEPKALPAKIKTLLSYVHKHVFLPKNAKTAWYDGQNPCSGVYIKNLFFNEVYSPSKNEFEAAQKKRDIQNAAWSDYLCIARRYVYSESKLFKHDNVSLLTVIFDYYNECVSKKEVSDDNTRLWNMHWIFTALKKIEQNRIQLLQEFEIVEKS